MSVEVRYHVIREGKEIAVYTSKKEADAHDKMLDIAEAMADFISQAENVQINDDVLEELCIHLAKNREVAIQLLKGGRVAPKVSKPKLIKPKEPESAPSAPERVGGGDLKQSSRPRERKADRRAVMSEEKPAAKSTKKMRKKAASKR